MRAKKRTILIIAGLLAVALIAGTLAYWNQTASVENPFDTGKYGTTLEEDFKPSEGEGWQPGVEVNKDVFVKNTGDQDLIVRARLDETWTRKGETAPYKSSAAAAPNGYDVYTTNQADPLDGLTAADGSVVTKAFGPSTNWIDGGDGWYYYKSNLVGGASTDKWLDSVTLLADADMGKLETKYYVSASSDANPALWVWFEYTGTMPAWINSTTGAASTEATGGAQVLHNKTETSYVLNGTTPLMGYSESDYVLKVTSQTVQPTQDAIDAIFGGGGAFTAPAGTAWVLK